MAARPVGAGRGIDHFERRLRAEGFDLIAGVDEAGRGALAGPLHAAAVILPADFDCLGPDVPLNDSKQLTALQRDVWFDLIVAGAVAVSVRRAFPRRIDRRGLHLSNLKLLRQAVQGLSVQPEFVLADGFHLRGMGAPALAVKKGDCVCASVAAASVVAKVTRDRAMDRYHRRFPRYGFDHNRGYGTAGHRAAIASFGPSPIHRLSFKGLKLYAEDRDTYLALYRRGGAGTGDGDPASEEEP